jgi:quercetin dioxygenase-like cupin family protein
MGLPECFRKRLEDLELTHPGEILKLIKRPWPDMTCYLKEMSFPCLVYAGEEDEAFHLVRESVKKMPNCTFCSKAGLNHIRSFIRSDLLLREVNAFLSSLRPMEIGNHSPSFKHISVPKVAYSAESKNMCGDGQIETFSDSHSPESPYTRAMYVQFKNGAYTKWHCHEAGQVLVVTEGIGFVEEYGKAPHFQITPYDRIYIPPCVWHGHGALEGR